MKFARQGYISIQQFSLWLAIDLGVDKVDEIIGII